MFLDIFELWRLSFHQILNICGSRSHVTPHSSQIPAHVSWMNTIVASTTQILKMITIKWCFKNRPFFTACWGRGRSVSYITITFTWPPPKLSNILWSPSMAFHWQSIFYSPPPLVLCWRRLLPSPFPLKTMWSPHNPLHITPILDPRMWLVKRAIVTSFLHYGPLSGIFPRHSAAKRKKKSEVIFGPRIQ